MSDRKIYSVKLYFKEGQKYDQRRKERTQRVS